MVRSAGAGRVTSSTRRATLRSSGSWSRMSWDNHSVGLSMGWSAMYADRALCRWLDTPPSLSHPSSCASTMRTATKVASRTNAVAAMVCGQRGRCFTVMAPSRVAAHDADASFLPPGLCPQTHPWGPSSLRVSELLSLSATILQPCVQHELDHTG